MTVRTPKQNRGRGPAGQESDGPVAVNEVRLVGRVAAEPVTRTLPSGDTLVTFRLVVDRAPGGRSAQTVDALECSAWTARVQRSVLRWRPGDVVEVTGAIRRRFFRGAGGAASRVEVEVASAKLSRRPRDA
jgi:single-strand DNA-binding protein